MLLLGIVLFATQGALVAPFADRPIGPAVQVALLAELMSLAQLMLAVFIAAAVVALVAFMIGRRGATASLSA
jgi:hypothetical protein